MPCRGVATLRRGCGRKNRKNAAPTVHRSRGIGRAVPPSRHLPAVAVRLSAQRTARPDSDVDLLVAFEPNAVSGLFKLLEIEQEMSEL
jgi:hypothetical protein